MVRPRRPRPVPSGFGRFIRLVGGEAGQGRPRLEGEVSQHLVPVGKGTFPFRMVFNQMARSVRRRLFCLLGFCGQDNTSSHGDSEVFDSVRYSTLAQDTQICSVLCWVLCKAGASIWICVLPSASAFVCLIYRGQPGTASIVLCTP
jgi:hypothetical protein